ncbi:jg7853 [Pararge aegeria aegeria]|uniref:Jg7853 protein n=1 Tax=Pararge aegeria aegeria TaxID=348720 RepID=A0A8S4S4Q1_9NEOP|nr:jg7853 [Pararge aegeria aegeria]
MSSVRETSRHIFDQNPSVPEDQSLEQMRVANDDRKWLIRRLRVSAQMQSAILEVSDYIRNEEIRRRIRVTDIAQRVAKLKRKWAGQCAPPIWAGHMLGKPMDVGVSRCWNGDPTRVNAALVGPQRSGQTISIESLGAAGNKRPRIVEFGTPYKRTMSSSGRQPVDLMKYQDKIDFSLKKKKYIFYRLCMVLIKVIPKKTSRPILRLNCGKFLHSSKFLAKI